MFPASGWVGDWKLCVAVDGDARQVVPDDLVNCKGTEEKIHSVVTRFLMSLMQIKAIVQADCAHVQQQDITKSILRTNQALCCGK